ncbi:NAD(P)-dependent oxidoreductase [Leptolyngbya sp. FACHB-321]|uniref:NAD-dependent epimerase/dehydratase family protein n=1 Tax=Leptolyngbya sp. FACHB-321 TaxID=2692807 RepID=UPI001683D665|nr:NAD(P)-dependent oxidoreductase [Leptolyngbya sp. FACHB-321]MBD2036494.1 NAD(P)-dependent oxidoreductase [Leptolyngbya sp. FACHB-321]
MTLKRIFVTGASGCIGHYVVEALIQETNHELFLLVRNPEKLKFDYRARPGINILQADLRDIEQFSDLLKTIDCAVLIATAWGGAQEVYETNVVKTLRLLSLLDPEVCQQAIYFATASILDRNNQPLKEAESIGTDYIRSKYACFQQFPKLKIAPRITTLFPTLLLGGDANKPQSHVSSGVVQVANWAWLLRFLKAEGSFHFIHGKDIAQIVRHLIDHPPAEGERRQLVLGNQMVTVNQAIEETCLYLNKRLYFRIPLTPKLANLFIALFRIKMADWDRFSMHYRHFTHRHVVSPETFGLPTYCATFMDVLKLSGVSRR